MVVRDGVCGSPWKGLIRLPSRRSFGITGPHSKRPIHAMTVTSMTRSSRRCSIAAILRKWDLSRIVAAPVENPAESPSPASLASAYPVPRCMRTAGRISSADDCSRKSPTDMKSSPCRISSGATSTETPICSTASCKPGTTASSTSSRPVPGPHSPSGPLSSCKPVADPVDTTPIFTSCSRPGESIPKADGNPSPISPTNSCTANGSTIC